MHHSALRDLEVLPDPSSDSDILHWHTPFEGSVTAHRLILIRSFQESGAQIWVQLNSSLIDQDSHTSQGTILLRQRFHAAEPGGFGQIGLIRVGTNMV